MFSFRRPLWWLSLSPLVRLPRLRHALLMLRKLEASRASESGVEEPTQVGNTVLFSLGKGKPEKRQGGRDAGKVEERREDNSERGHAQRRREKRLRQMRE